MKKFNTLTHKVYWWLNRLILDSEIVPGQRLVFADIARRLNVSRTPVNNALAILAQEGYLDFVPNQGYAVHRLNRQEKQDLYEIREAIEVGFIGQSIRKMTDTMLKNLTQRMIKLENLISGNFNRKVFLLDMELHEAFLNMAGNFNLSSHYREICQKIYIGFRPDDLSATRIFDLQKEHEDLLEAVELKDTDRAKKILHEHRIILENLERPVIPAPVFRNQPCRVSPGAETAISHQKIYGS
ncbi:GntR family transcriptional regulator [Desulfocicer niacini]